MECRLLPRAPLPECGDGYPFAVNTRFVTAVVWTALPLRSGNRTGSTVTWVRTSRRRLFLLELGGRPAHGEPADYAQMALNPLFKEGLSRVEETAVGDRLALMCSEHEPLECHRCLLVGRRLVERGMEVAHILRDGRVEPHATTEDRLLKLARQTADDLLETRAERLCRAYRNQNHRICRLGMKQGAGHAPSR